MLPATPSRLTPITAGIVEARILLLDAPISFWGGIDWEDGYIIDRLHPQCGVSIGGMCLMIPAVIGSGGTSGTLAELLRRGRGPAGIVIPETDINLMAGIEVASKLYDAVCPMFVCRAQQLHSFPNNATISIAADGSWRLV